MTQCKALLELGGLGEEAETWQVGDLAEVFGVSVPSMSRAVDALVKARAGDPGRGPRGPARPPGRDHRQGQGAGRHRCSPSARPGSRPSPRASAAAQRRKLDAAVDSLMDREDIAATYEHLKEVERA